MNITINVEDSQLAGLIEKTTAEIGTEFFGDIMKAAFTEYIKEELKSAFACLAGQYHTGDRNTDSKNKEQASSILRSLFVKAGKQSGGFYSPTIVYEPTEYLSNIITGLDIKEEMVKYKDELMSTLHESIDGYIVQLMKSLFVGNVMMDPTFQTSLRQQMDFSVGFMFQKHLQENHQNQR